MDTQPYGYYQTLWVWTMINDGPYSEPVVCVCEDEQDALVPSWHNYIVLPQP